MGVHTHVHVHASVSTHRHTHACTLHTPIMIVGTNHTPIIYMNECVHAHAPTSYLWTVTCKKEKLDAGHVTYLTQPSE